MGGARPYVSLSQCHAHLLLVLSLLSETSLFFSRGEMEREMHVGDADEQPEPPRRGRDAGISSASTNSSTTTSRASSPAQT